MQSLVVFFFVSLPVVGQYAWMEESQGARLDQRFFPPTGYLAMSLSPESFGSWLRRLPLKPEGSKVLLFNGEPKANQSAHVAVVDMDVGRRDLQQCADAVIRLRAEYLWSQGRYGELVFNFTNGTPARWADWQVGRRPVVKGNKVSWQQQAPASSSYQNFRKWLDTVFSYAGSASLVRELERVSSAADIEPGDVFIQGGYPGHAVLVLDVALDKKGNRHFLLGQSYMPAQEFQVLRGPAGKADPWYPAQNSGVLQTPEWTFSYTDLYRFSGK